MSQPPADPRKEWRHNLHRVPASRYTCGSFAPPFHSHFLATDGENLHPTRRRPPPMSSVKGRAVQVTAAGGDFKLVQQEFPDPGPGHVRIRIQACGVCHSDSLTKLGIWPGIQY